MNPTAMIAEDEPAQRESLARLLSEHWPELQLVAECEDGISALESLIEKHPQVVFLDIRMPGLSGIEVARAAAKADAQIIFVTAYDEYAVAAFDRGAADYLLKPVTPERLQQTIARVQKRLAQPARADLSQLLEALDVGLRARQTQTNLKWVTASLGDTVKMFPIEDVLFFQAQDKYVRVVTMTDEAVIRTPLKDLIRQLDPETFWQIHRSLIVRASVIERVQKDALGHYSARIRGHAESLPVSASFQSRFKSM
jgi:DNA-binding LytR/AlgR family response regulator